MEKEKYLSDIREKFPAYKDVDDNKLFVDFSKKFPAYIASDENLKKEFLELANENEEYSSNNIKLTPKEVYTLAATIPEYRPPESEFEQFKKHDPDVDWAETGKAAIAHIGNMVAQGFSWDEDANMAATVVEGGLQGYRGLTGMATQSADPNSLFFKGKKFLGELFNEEQDGSGYRQWLEARDFAQQTYRLEQGEEQLLSEEFKVNRKAASALGLVLDPSLFVSFGSGTVAKGLAKAASVGATGAGKGLKAGSKLVSRPIEKITEVVSEGIAKTLPDTPKGTVQVGLGATGLGAAVVNPTAQAAGVAYGGAKVAEAAGDIIQGVGEQIAGQPSRLGLFAGLAADPNKSRLTRGVSRTASILGGDSVLSTAGAATRGAIEGGAVGAGLGYLTAREEGAAGGLSGGAAFGVAGGLAGHGFRKLSGIQRKSAIQNEFRKFLESRPEVERQGIVKMTGGDLEQAALVMDLHNLIIGNSKQDVAIQFLKGDDFLKLTGGQRARGIQYIQGDKPAIAINTDYEKGAYTLAHESFHAIKNLDGMDAYFQRLKNEIVGIEGAGGKTIREGILTKKDLTKLAVQYMNKFSDANKAEFRKDWVNKTVEELSAEWFAALLTGGKRDSLLAGKGFDSLTRRALDRLLLADADSTFGKMQNALQNVFGVKFGATGESIGSMVFKDVAGNPLKHGSPVVQAIMRDMVRGKRAIRDAHHIDNKLSKNVIRTRNLSQQEMSKLRDTVKGSALEEIFVTDKKGRLKTLTPKQAAVVEAETSAKIIDAIDKVPDTGESSHVRKTVDEKGNTVYSGLKFSEAQLKEIYKSDIHPSIKEFLGTLHESLGDGRIFDIEYWAALRKGSYASIKLARRNVVPYNILVSSDGNFYARALDISALDRKFQDWKKGKKEWLEHWDSDVDFYRDIQGYLTNLALPEPTPSASLFGETKRNIMNEFIGARGRKGMNPLALLNVAEKEFLIRSFRLDRMASLNLDNSFRRFPFSETSYKLNKVNFMPDEMPKSLVDMDQARDGNVSTEQVVIGDDLKFMPELIDQKVVDPKAIKGKKAFFMYADRMKVGTHTTRSGKVYNLRGGSDHPDIVDNMGIVAWAVDGGGVGTGLEKAINSTDGIGIVLLMGEESVAGNADYAAIMLDEISYDIGNNKHYAKLFPSLLKKANKAIKKSAFDAKVSTLTADNKKLPTKEKLSKKEIEKRAQKSADNIKPLSSIEDIRSKYRKMPFSQRKAMWTQLAPSNLNKAAKDLGVKINHKFSKGEVIFWKDLVSDIIDRKDSEGYRTGDVSKIIQFKQGKPIKRPEETGTPAHTSYDLLVEGKSLGNPEGFINVLDLLRDDLKIIKGGEYEMLEGDIGHSGITAMLQKNVLGDKDKGLNPVLRGDSFTPKGKKGLTRFKLDDKGLASQKVGPKKELETRRNINEELGGSYSVKRIPFKGKGKNPIEGSYMPEVGGKFLGPNSEQLLHSLLDGKINRQQWDQATEILRPIDKEVDVPNENDVHLTQENLDKLSATMSKDKFPLVGEAQKYPDGYEVGLRIDIPTYNNSVSKVASGELEKPVYAVTIHHKKENKSKLGKVIGYDIFSRVEDFTFNITSQKTSEKIGIGKINKTTMATAEGKLIQSRALPSSKELRENWIQVGMNPKRHSYFYDRKTGKAVKGGAEAISFGNTVYVRKPKFHTEDERLSLFTYMPETVGESKVSESGDGYKAIEREGKTRVYSPRGKLIGVASSEKVADKIYRKHSGIRTNNIRK